MTLFTVEVQGRPVVVFAERDRDAAGEFVAKALAEGLAVFEHDGQPVWDGKSELFVREAHPEEATRWEAGFAQALRDGDAGHEDRDNNFGVWLIDTEDPTAIEDDDEE
jgi:hypothetical protein